MTSDEFIKIRIVLPETDWHEFGSETLWAMPIGNGHHVLQNSPFFAEDLSYLDTVYVELEDENDFPVFKFVVNRSGHSTYGLVIDESIDFTKFQEYILPIIDLGCSFEGMQSVRFSLDVPATTNIYQVYDLLKRGEEEKKWVFYSLHIGPEIH
jgi:Domain of unknown function (DUF4265)